MTKSIYAPGDCICRQRFVGRRLGSLQRGDFVRVFVQCPKNKPVSAPSPKSPPRPQVFEDRFSSVVGESFHFMDRPKVPMHHDGKKGYFVALRQAWFQWDLTKLAEVKANLRVKRGMNDSEIETMLYYDVDYSHVRVPHFVLPPSKLYWRVRAVYEMYGPMLDAKTKAPLFNKAAWKRANNVHKEIIVSNASDPCGMTFYSQQPAYDSNEHALLDCSRGSNDTECAHKLFITTLGHGIQELRCRTFFWPNGTIDTISMFWRDEHRGKWYSWLYHRCEILRSGVDVPPWTE